MIRDSLQILLIEDDATLAEITSFRLELLGYEVASCSDPHEALDWLDKSLPDVILLDLALGGNEGFDLLNRLSNAPRTSDVPVMVFSTSADLSHVQRAYAAGAEEYLVTPYDPVNLEQKIEKLRILRKEKR